MQKRCMGCMGEYGVEYDICPYCGYVDGTPVEEQIHMEPGTILHNRYIIGKVLGYGGFGVTYLGWDGKLEMKVAIKEYLPSEFSTRMPGQTKISIFRGEKKEQFEEGLGKFVDEAKRLANFKNEEGIVRVYDSFEENDTAYIIMEYLDGETLTEYMEREGTIPEDKAVKMLMPIMKSLQIVHKEGILHRDIAPDNIFITKTGETKLIDFGASRYATTSHSRSLTVIIKPGYSPEEQYRSNGDQGPHTDVYALGATLYKMLTGKTPPDAMERRAKFEGQNKDILIEPRKLNKNISQVRETAILNAMNVRVQDRTPDIQTFIEELESTYPAKRRYGKIKKIDVYSWPLWLKITIPAVLSVILVFGILLATGVISFASLFSDTVNVPDGYVVTPNVEGLSLDEAYNTLEKNELQPQLVDSVTSDYIETDQIVLQTPEGGKYSKINSTVSLTVSKGNGEIIEAKNGIATVPYLIGSSENEAKAAISKAGLKCSIEYEYSDNVAKGLVISQSPKYNTEVDEGATVNLIVSKGKKEQQNSKSETANQNSSNNNVGNNNNNSGNSNENNNNKDNDTYQHENDNSANNNSSNNNKPATPKRITISFISDGSTVSTKTVSAGSQIGSFPNVNKDYYTFNGWYDSNGSRVSEGTVVNTDTTISASWTKNAKSDWVLESNVPYGAYVEPGDQKWTYSGPRIKSKSNGKNTQLESQGYVLHHIEKEEQPLYNDGVQTGYRYYYWYYYWLWDDMTSNSPISEDETHVNVKKWVKYTPK